MNKLKKLDLELKHRFLGLKTKIDGPYGTPDNSINWFLEIEDFLTNKNTIIVEYNENKDIFGLSNLDNDCGYGWGAPDETCDTLEETLNKTVEMIFKINKMKE